jgi:hypothetical protein
MTEEKMPSRYALHYLDEIKKDYQKLKEKCGLYEREQRDFFQRIGLDLDAFNIDSHPEHPAEDIFNVLNLSDRDRQMLGEYLDSREKMYLLEQCVRSITDEDTRCIAKAYYLERKTQPEIATKIGHTKSYVSKRLDKTEKDEMAETIDRYFAWKYSVPGGKDCFWAGEQEKLYMREQDARHLIFHLPKMPDMSWMKSLRRMGF